jgi:DNA-binding transcriptional regulator YiaG
MINIFAGLEGECDVMAKSFNKLVDKMSHGSQARIRARIADVSREMALQEVRQALQLTQQQLADTLEMNQAAVSKLEHQSDMYISTLRKFLEAMGGNLKIVASFPEGEIVINQFGNLLGITSGRGKGIRLATGKPA